MPKDSSADMVILKGAVRKEEIMAEA